MLTRNLNHTPCEIHEKWFSSPYLVEWEPNNDNPYCLDNCLEIQDLPECCLSQNRILCSLQKLKYLKCDIFPSDFSPRN